MAAESKIPLGAAQPKDHSKVYQKERKLVREIKETQKLIQDLKSRNQIGHYSQRKNAEISVWSNTSEVRDKALRTVGLKLKEVENVHVSAEIA